MYSIIYCNRHVYLFLNKITFKYVNRMTTLSYNKTTKAHKVCVKFGHWCTIGVPSFLADFRMRSPLLGEGIHGSIRLGRLGIGMIPKSAKKDGTPIVHQCLNLDLICSPTSSWDRPSFQLWLKFSPVGKIVCETRCQTCFPEKKGEHPVLKQKFSLFVFHMFKNQPNKWSSATVLNLGYGSKQVLRSTIPSSTILSFFFDNSRIGRF